MYGTISGHPLLDVIVLVVSGLLGFVFVADVRGPLAKQPPITRYVAMIVVAAFAHRFFSAVVSLLSPLANSVFTASSVLQAFAGLILVGGLVGSFLVLRGDVTLSLPTNRGGGWQPGAPTNPTYGNPVYTSAPGQPPYGQSQTPGPGFNPASQPGSAFGPSQAPVSAGPFGPSQAPVSAGPFAPTQTPASPSETRCRQCNGLMRSDAKFCNGCGTPV